MRTASLLHVPMPEHPRGPGAINEYYSIAMYSHNKLILTDKGIHHLRKEIRDEQAEQREVHASWIRVLTSLIAAFTGLLGVLLGIIIALGN